MSRIEWTGRTWNPVTGCDRISEGCEHCYALTLARRLKAMGQPNYQTDGDPRTSGPGFGVAVHDDALQIPMRRQIPTVWFVNSMSDLFHAKVPAEFIARVWWVMATTPQHTYQILTKRPQRMARLLGPGGAVTEACADAEPLWLTPPIRDELGTYNGDHELFPAPNVWLGTSIELNRHVGRADALRATPAAVRFLSCEPLLGPLPDLDLTGIDWVIVGGESGPGSRPMHPQWARDIRDRCTDAGVPFFFKQWGDWKPTDSGTHIVTIDGDVSERQHRGSLWCGQPAMVGRLGKGRAGRVLDGEIQDAMPEGVTRP